MSEAPARTEAGFGPEQLRTLIDELLAAAPDGEPLDAPTQALIELGVCASVATLDGPGTDAAVEAALDAGASADQVHEALMLVAGLGVHTLMLGSPRLAAALRRRGEGAIDAPLDERRVALWAKYVGEDRFWLGFEEEFPGFLDDMLRLSPEAFEAFFELCAVPWRTGSLSAQTKELIAIATDAVPSHRFAPGLRLHLRGALKVGAGRRAIEEALEIAADTPPHTGVGR